MIFARFVLYRHANAATTAQTRAITPPYASDHSGENMSAIKPVIGPPIGVLPKNATAVSASNRPRMSGGDSCWLIAFPAAIIAAPRIPRGTLHKNAIQ